MEMLSLPKRLVARLFPGLEFRETFITLSGCFLLVLFLYHGRASHFAHHLPDLAGSLSPGQAAMGGYVYSHMVSFVLLFLIPLGLITLVFRENPQQWGLQFTGSRKEFLIVVGMYLAFVPVLVWISSSAGFQSKYPKLKIIKDNAQLFFLYQGFYLVKWLAWEFFFRGYLLFGFARKYGHAAILFTTMPFVVVHLGKPQGEIFGAIAAGFILGRLALSGKSIFPGVWLHFMVAGTMDFLTCTFWK